jgi:hypothetical protein
MVADGAPLVTQVGLGALVYAGAAFLTALRAAPRAARLGARSVLAQYVTPGSP